VGQRHEPRPVARLRRADDAAHDRAADSQPRRPESSSRSLQRNAIASEIRSPVTASRSNSGRHFGDISSSSRASSSRVRKRRSLNSHARPPRRRGSTTASAAFWSSSPSATAAPNTARRGVSALATDRSHNLPAATPWQARQPVNEPLHGCTVDIAQAQLAVEVAQRERRQQPPVLAARVLPDAVATRAGVAIRPAERERVQRRPAPLRARLRVPGELDRPRLRQRRSRLLALKAAAAIDHDQARITPIHPENRVRCSGNPVTVAPLPACCHPGAFGNRPKFPSAKRNSTARPRGFEPLTFGSVATGPASPAPIGNSLHSVRFPGDTSGHESHAGSRLAPTWFPPVLPPDGAWRDESRPFANGGGGLTARRRRESPGASAAALRGPSPGQRPPSVSRRPCRRLRWFRFLRPRSPARG